MRHLCSHRSSLLAVVGGLGMAAACTAPMAAAGGLGGLDTNNDGVISRTEANAGQQRAFNHLDGNGDGKIGLGEFLAGDSGANADAGKTSAQARRDKAIQTALFHNLDKNKNGSISSAEYQDAVSPYFDRVDTNHDGVIDGQELRQATQQRP